MKEVTHDALCSMKLHEFSYARVAWDLYQVLRHRLNGDSGEAYPMSLYDYEHPPAKIERSEPK